MIAAHWVVYHLLASPHSSLSKGSCSDLPDRTFVIEQTIVMLWAGVRSFAIAEVRNH